MEKNEVKDVPDYKVVAGLRQSKLESIVDEYLRVRKELARLEERKNELKEAGVKLLVKAGVKTVMVGDIRTTVTSGSSSRISAEKLYELGVKETIIKKATTVTPWTSLTVTEPKE